MENIYPYKKYYLDLDYLVDLAIKYKPKYVHKENMKDVFRSINFKLEKYNDRFVLIQTDSSDSFYKINYITDLLTEECRVKSCHREKDNMTPFEYFNQYKLEISEYLEYKGIEINYENLNRFMEDGGLGISKDKNFKIPKPPSLCSNYKITYLLGILNHFKPKKWLDMSAGWGDRLCSAFIYGVEEYYGIDPSSCLNNEQMSSGYENIINILGKKFPEKISRKNFQTKAFVYNGPAETSPLLRDGNKDYDFIMTSPPFFTFELYDKENELQSTNQYNSIDKWLNDFLFKTIDRSWPLLTKNGNYLLYIEDKPEYRFIPKLIEFMKRKKDCKYEGIIYQAFLDKKYIKRPYDLHTVYCFRKL